MDCKPLNGGRIARACALSAALDSSKADLLHLDPLQQAESTQPAHNRTASNAKLDLLLTKLQVSDRGGTEVGAAVRVCLSLARPSMRGHHTITALSLAPSHSLLTPCTPPQSGGQELAQERDCRHYQRQGR